jgi:hypothetical protein
MYVSHKSMKDAVAATKGRGSLPAPSAPEPSTLGRTTTDVASMLPVPTSQSVLEALAASTPVPTLVLL